MNILLAYTLFSNGCGISTHLEILSRELLRREHQVSLVSWPTPQALALQHKGRLHYYAAPLDQSQKTLLHFVRSLIIIRQIIRQERIDIIHAHHRWAGFVSHFACLGTKAVLVSTDHNILQGRRALSRWGQQVITVSEAGRQHLETYFGLNPSQISVIYNAIEYGPMPTAHDVAVARARLGIDSSTPLIGVVGRLAEQKGHRFLLQAAGKIRNRVPDTKILVVGEGLLRDELKTLAATLDLGDAVCFIGHQDDVPHILIALDLLVMPSLWEGLPYVLLEAMSVGTPVVASAVGGVPEIVVDGTTGLLVPPGDAAALAQAVIHLLLDREQARAMGLAGRTIVERRFSLTATMERVETVYWQAVTRKR